MRGTRRAVNNGKARRTVGLLRTPGLAYASLSGQLPTPVRFLKGIESPLPRRVPQVGAPNRRSGSPIVNVSSSQAATQVTSHTDTK